MRATAKSRPGWRVHQALVVALGGALFMTTGLSSRSEAQDSPPGDETRPIQTKPGGPGFLAGVAAFQSPGLGASGVSVTLGMMYAGERFSLPVEFRSGWSPDQYQKPALYFFSASVGGRGYLTKRGTSPYVGAGLGLLSLGTRNDGDPGYSPKTGPGVYLELGVETLRLHRASVALALRVDLPMEPLESEEPIPSRTKYVWPVSIGVTVAF
jgi:hypothetical protein